MRYLGAGIKFFGAHICNLMNSEKKKTMFYIIIIDTGDRSMMDSTGSGFIVKV